MCLLGNVEIKEVSLKAESGRPEGGALSLAHRCLQPVYLTGRRKTRIISMREGIFYIGSVSLEFKKRKEDPSLPQQ